MTRKLAGQITSAHLISLIALFVALGGSVYAANKISGKTIKRGSEPGNRLKKNSVTGKQVKESALGNVPSASIANTAFSTFHDDLIPFPDAPAPIARLSIPKAGSFVVVAKLEAFDSSLSNSAANVCTLSAGSDADNEEFDVASSSTDDQEAVALQLVHTFTAPGSVVLSCSDGGLGLSNAKYTKITAIEVASITNQPF
jgi:hypothetical protein